MRKRKEALLGQNNASWKRAAVANMPDQEAVRSVHFVTAATALVTLIYF
jgi:hypothetical protein